jgi:hypothetical protein
VVRACDCSSISCRSGIVHFFQAISKTLGGGERRFGDSRESFISSEWHILRGVLGRVLRGVLGRACPPSLRSGEAGGNPQICGHCEVGWNFFQIWLSKRDNPSSIAGKVSHGRLSEDCPAPVLHCGLAQTLSVFCRTRCQMHNSLRHVWTGE